MLYELNLGEMANSRSGQVNPLQITSNCIDKATCDTISTQSDAHELKKKKKKLSPPQQLLKLYVRLFYIFKTKK